MFTVVQRIKQQYKQSQLTHLQKNVIQLGEFLSGVCHPPPFFVSSLLFPQTKTKIKCLDALGANIFQNFSCYFEMRLHYNVLKKKENSNIRKHKKFFQAPGENQTHDPPSSRLEI